MGVATPPAALNDAAAALKGYAGIIVSAMAPGAGGYELKRDNGTSAAEQLARLVPTGRRHCVHVHFLGIELAAGQAPALSIKADLATARGVQVRGRHSYLFCQSSSAVFQFDSGLRGGQGALATYSKGLAKGVAPQGVRVTMISPG